VRPFSHPPAGCELRFTSGRPLVTIVTVTSRGDRTRDQIINAAELLFAERGLYAVSLREINVAADQRNTAALHYHFHGRDGVITAIVKRHLPRIDSRQRELLDKLIESGDEHDLRGLVDAALRLLAEYVEMGASERAWMKICADWVSQPALSTGELDTAGSRTGRELRRRWVRRLREQMPAPLARERVLIIFTAALNILADRARLLDAPETSRPVLADEVFSANLADMACGALTAPVSPAAAEALTRP
jgi:AcrR family transcriptional regulator